jgi:RNA polymerase sigma-B factor
MTATATQAPIGEVMAVRPGDTAAASEVDGWLQDYTGSRDPALRERIILAYLGLADRLADRYRHSRGTTPEDLRQTARAGLIAAIDRYDPDYANPFVPYAVACVVGEIKRYLRDTSWRLHVPRPLKEQALRVCKTADQLQQTLGRSPTTSELAQRLGVAEEEVLEALAVAHSRQELSLDRPVGDDTDSCLGDLVASPAAREETEDLLLLPTLVAELPEPDRTVIVLRFFHDLGQDAIAAEVGYSQMHVSRLLRRALVRMRAQLIDS